MSAISLPLVSAADSSVNFVGRLPGQPGFTEARYVRRRDNEVIVYLSCQTGCRQACRFCHLTQTGQTQYVDVTVDGLLAQARTVLEHYDRQLPASMVNFNFMARGEVFASPHVLADGDRLCFELGQLAADRGLVARCKFSTIMPQATMADRRLTDVFRIATPDIYLSLYSMRPEFRRRWLPKALDPQAALRQLADWQQITRKIPVIHWALIADENDSALDAQLIADAVNDVKLHCDVNLVRYNSANDRTGSEPSADITDRYARALAGMLDAGEVRVVDRVGYDVKASCGMFVS
jgi:23S rRNA (adenine2503-C2)-methyltransferase